MTRNKHCVYILVMTSPTEYVTATIRAEVARRRLTQRELAEALGISQQSVHNRLSGKVVIDLHELGIIADTLGVTVESLVRAPESVA